MRVHGVRKVLAACDNDGEVLVRVGWLDERKRQLDIWKPEGSRLREAVLRRAVAFGAAVCVLGVRPKARRALRDDLGYGMLCGPDPKRNDSWTLRVDVPPLRFGVVVRVDLHSCAGNVVPAVLDVENRADLGRERPSEAFPRTGQPETFRRYRAGEPYGASYWPLSGYGIPVR